MVEDFLAAFEALNVERALALVDDDCVYQNVPFHRARGKKRIARDLGLMIRGLKEFHVDMTHIATNGNVVMTERVDTLGNRFTRASVSIMGVFVVEDGLITEWRDYFDWSQCIGRVAKGLVLKPFRRG